MLQFNLRSVLMLVSLTALLLAAWQYSQFAAGAVTVVLASVVSRIWATKTISNSFILWMLASGGAAAAMVFLLLVDFLIMEFNQSPVHIGWERALPMSLVMGIAVGSVVSVLHGLVLRFSPKRMRSEVSVWPRPGLSSKPSEKIASVR
ncbi:MAG: hypothetical protein AAFX06_28535 [Planctomycetota bacterium]